MSETREYYVTTQSRRETLSSIARISTKAHKNSNIEYRTFCKISNPKIKKSVYVMIKGNTKKNKIVQETMKKGISFDSIIRMDYAQRKKLGIKKYTKNELTLKKIKFGGPLLVNLFHLDPNVKFKFKITLFSIILAIVGLLLASFIL